MGSRCISTTARGLPLRTYFLQSSYYRRILTTNSPPEPMTNTHRPPPRLCAWAGMAAGMRSAPQVSAKGELHTSPQPVVKCVPHPRAAHFGPIRRTVKTEAPKRKKVCRDVEKEKRSVLSFAGVRR
ncbi:hypothetical protein LCGC14_3000060 [marine sediment metagenome]|uniref:Uncharacterized protein n=1 Tax=marine sediment metagenome TaxID=412755 RepID=A0A0F8XNZ4_9ZZZZ